MKSLCKYMKASILQRNNYFHVLEHSVVQCAVLSAPTSQYMCLRNFFSTAHREGKGSDAD